MQVSLLIKYPLMMGLLAMSFLWGASQLPEINLQAEKTFNLDSLVLDKESVVLVISILLMATVKLG
jgi:hypothetical protein